LNQQLHY